MANSVDWNIFIPQANGLSHLIMSVRAALWKLPSSLYLYWHVHTFVICNWYNITYCHRIVGPCNAPDYCIKNDRDRGEESDCTKYWFCLHAKWQLASCAPGTEFDINTRQCVLAGQAVCEGPCPTTVPFTGTVVTVPPGKIIDARSGIYLQISERECEQFDK